MRSGQPFTPRVSNAVLDNGEANRPDRIGNGKLSNPTPERWFDTSAFVPVPLGAFRFGNSGRNILDGPGQVNMNLALSRRFRVYESHAFQLRSGGVQLHQPRELRGSGNGRRRRRRRHHHARRSRPRDAGGHPLSVLKVYP